MTHGGEVSWVTSDTGDPRRSARLDLAEFEPFEGYVWFRHGAKALANGDLK